MKKFLLIPFLSFIVLSIAACGKGSEESFTPEQPEQPGNSDNGGNTSDDKSDDNQDVPTPGENSRYLVLYASRTSNTEHVAQLIQTTLKCDMIEVEPETPYDNNYNAMLERAQKELAAVRQGDYPQIKTSIDKFDDYDIIFVGYPIWYSSMATPMQTFLHEHASKLSGKRIALFATSGSSGISVSVNEVHSLCPESTIIDPTLLLTSSSLSQMESRVPAWLESIGASKEEQADVAQKINIVTPNRTITATIEDNAAGKDFLSRLPLEVTLNDYNNTTEKIFYPDPALTVEGVTRGCTPTSGDITIYAPWGNIAIFCKSWSHSNDLIKIGHIDGDGIDALNVAGDVTVKFEKQ